MNSDLNGVLTDVKLMAKKILVAAGTQTAAGVDLRDFIGELMVIIATEGDNGDGGATIVVSILGSADNTTFATFAGAPAPTTITAASALNSVSVDTRNPACPRYIQAHALTASTTATFVTGVVGLGLKQRI